VNRADREHWASARTLADLGELTALWLEGAISERPGYSGAPAEETTSLIQILAACNRAGFVTEGSQPGGCGIYEGTFWSQRAAVQGFADPVTMVKLYDATEGLPVMRSIHCAPRWRNRYKSCLPVTRTDARVCTRFGAAISRRDLADGWVGYGLCHPDGVRAICDAWQVTLVDAEWGRSDSPLWSVLAAFAGLEVAS